MQLMSKLLAFTLTGIFFSACTTGRVTGRAANLTTQTNSWDSDLSCTHLFGEYKNNNKRLAELKGERSDKTVKNVGEIIYSVALFQSLPWAIDVSGSEKKEAASIISRQTVLLSYMEDKTCPEFDQIEAARIAAEAAQADTSN